jgi:beta-lactamase regulating signal transducer with metallopeptidase domain
MTLAGWMVFALAISLLVAPAARLLEYGAARLGVPTRWVWLGALALTVALPNAAVLDAGDGPPSEQQSGTGVTVALDGERVPVRAEAADPRLLKRILGAVATGRSAVDRGLSAAIGRARVDADVERWVGGAWLVTSLLLGLALVVSTRRLERRARTWPTEIVLGRAVRRSPDLGPATLGLLHPEVVVPRWASGLPADELELVLSHEEEHVRKRDPLLLAVGLVSVLACPWNPVIWWQHRRLRDAVELDCDRRVLRRGAPPRRYGDVLLKVGARGTSRLLPATTLTGSGSLLERRLAAMKTSRIEPALAKAFCATATSLALLVIACTTEPPVAAEAGRSSQASAQERNEGVADVWVQPDGSVYVNDELHAMDSVSEVIGRLGASSPGSLVVSVTADPIVPYGVVDELQRELRAAGALRVAFTVSGSRPAPTPPGDERHVVEGLGMVLPEEGAREPVSGRNLLHLVVQPSGTVHVSRGVAGAVQRVRAEEIEAIWRQEVATNPKLIAVMKIHEDASYTHMLDVLDALQAAAAQRISIQVMAAGEVAETAPVAAPANQDRLTRARAELRALRDRYSDDYPPIRTLQSEISALERLAVR